MSVRSERRLWLGGAVVFCAAATIAFYWPRSRGASTSSPARANEAVPDVSVRLSERAASHGTSAVRGIVRDSSGAAVVSEVWIEGTSLRPGRSVRTDSHGAFEIDGLEEGIYSVSARSDGQAIAPRFGLRLGVGDTRFLTLFAESGYSFTLRVLEQGSDHPIANARVRFSSSPWFVEGLGERRTGANGELSLWAASTQVFAHVDADSFVEEAATSLDKDSVRVVHLSRGMRVAGEVRDERGELVTDGIVEASSVAQVRAADVQGNDVPGNDVSGNDSSVSNAATAEHESLGTTARVPPLPLDGFASAATLEENTVRTRVTRTIFVAIGANGTFIFPAIPSGVFHFQARGPAFLDGEPLAKNTGEISAPISLRVVRAAQLNLRVRRVRDSSVVAPEFCAQCPLVVRSGTREFPVTTSDVGEGRLPQLRAGTFSALYQGRVLATIELHAGEARAWELQVGAEAGHRLQVVDANGSAVRAAHVLLEWQRSGETAHGDTDPQGQVHFSGQSGAVRVRVSHPNFANFVASWPQLAERVVLQDGGCAVATSLISRATAERIERADVIWVRDSTDLDSTEAARVSASSDHETEFVAAHLPVGSHYVFVRADGYAMVAQPVADVCAQTRLEIALEPLFLFEGDVVDALGSTQAGVRVWLEGHEAGEATSDAAGHYALHAPAGESVVHAQSSVGEASATLTMSHRDRLQPFVLHLERRAGVARECRWTRAFDDNLRVRLSTMTARAGLLPTDTLRVMGNMPMQTHEDFASACTAGGSVRIQIERDGQLIDAWMRD